MSSPLTNIQPDLLRLFVSASDQLFYRMSADWQVMEILEGKEFLADINNPGTGWIDQYILPEDRGLITQAIQQAIDHKTIFQLEHRIRSAGGSVSWIHSRAIPVLDEHGNITEWYGAAADITKRRSRNRQQDYLLRLADRLRPLTSAVNIQEAAARMIGEQLNVIRAFYFTVEKRNEGYIHRISKDYYSRPGMQTVVGAHAQADYGKSIYASLSLGNNLVIPDIKNIPELTAAELQKHLALDVRSLVIVPLVKDGRYVAAFAVNDNHSRNWTEEEIRLIEETAERTWAAVEKASAEDALQKSEDKYRTIFKTIEEGFCIYELVYDDQGKPVDLRWVEVNPAYEKQTGLKDTVGKLASEVMPGTETSWLDIYDKVAKTGEAVHFENWHEPTGRWYYTFTSRIGNAGSRQVAVLFSDITERKQREAQQEFLLKLTDNLRAETGVEAVGNRAVKMIAEELSVDRVYLVSLNPEEDNIIVTHETHRKDMPPLVGSYRGSDFPAAIKEIFEHTVIYKDVRSDARLTDLDRLSFAGLGAVGFIAVPIHGGNKGLISAAGAVSAKPLSWSDDEVILFENAVERAWAAIEKARAEEALRISEEKYRSLYNSIDEGSYLCEVIFDENNKAVDILYLNENATAIHMLGQSFAGKRLREISPLYEEYWYQIWGDVALTGISTRQEQYSKADGKWFDFFLSKVEGKERQVVVLFNDITERKRQEEALRRSEEKYRTLFNSIDEGFQIYELIYDDAGKTVDFRYLETNPAYERQTGLKNVAGKLASEVIPNLESYWFDYFDEILASPVPLHAENYHQATGRWYSITSFRAFNDSRPIIAALFTDITERKQRESQQEFLLRLSDTLRTASDADSIATLAVTLLAKELHLDRCYIVARRQEGDLWDIGAEFRVSSLPPTPPVLDQREFPGSLRIITEETLVFNNTNELPGLTDMEKKGLQALGFGGLVMGVLRKGEKNPSWSMVAASVEPRQWTTGEVALVQEVGERTWAAIERAKAEEALRASEERQVFLLQLSDALRSLSDPTEIQHVAMQMLGQQLGVNRAQYYLADETGEYLSSSGGYTDGVPAAVGSFRLIEFGKYAYDGFHAGQTQVVSDATVDPRISETVLKSYKEVGFLAYIGVPFVQRGRLIGTVAVHQSGTRQWTDSERIMVEETAGRAGIAIEYARAEEALRQSQKRFQSIANLVPDLLWDSEPDGSTIWYNQRWLEYTGQRFEEAICGGWVDAIHPDDRAGSAKRYGEAVEAGKPLRQEHRIRRHDGAYRWFVVNASPLKNEKGRVIKMYCAATDIHDRKRAELNAAFLDSVTKMLAGQSTSDEIMTLAAVQIGQFFKVSACVFADVNEAENEVTTHGWMADGLPSQVKQTFRFEDYVTDELRRTAYAGEVFDINDTQHDWRVNAENYARMGIGAVAAFHFKWLGKWTNYLAVTDTRARVWREDEITLLQELSDRIFLRRERARSEEDLRESEEKYRTLFETMGQGYAELEIIRGPDGHAIDIRYVELNPQYERLTGIPVARALGRTVFEMFPDLDHSWIQEYDSIVRSGRPGRVEKEQNPSGRWFEAKIYPRAGERFSVLSEEITERKLQEQRKEFLLKLIDAIRPLSNPLEIQQAAMKTIGEQLGAHRAFYGDMLEDGDTLMIGPGYANSISPLEGYVRFSEFDSGIIANYRNGETVVINDIATDHNNSEANRAAMESIQVLAAVGVPLLKDGKVKGILSIHQSHTRKWTPAEISLIEETAERTWAAVERAKAEQALQKSEEKYRTLFNTIDEGYCVAELLLDEKGEVYDLIFREVNDAWTEKTGIPKGFNVRLSEMLPNLEDYWLTYYVEVFKTGVPIRKENYMHEVGRWFSAHYSLVGDLGSRFIAVVFDDVTERKHQEQRREFLLKLTDVLRTIANPVELEKTAMKLLAEELKVMRASYFEVQPDQDTFNLTARYEKDAVPIPDQLRLSDFSAALSNDYRSGKTLLVRDTEKEAETEAHLNAYRAIGVRAWAAVPLVKEGQLVAIVGVHSKTPRDWTNTEIKMLEELAERTWVAVERIKAEQALQKSERQLKELVKLKDEFIGIASHELKTPVTSMTLYAEMALEILSTKGLSSESKMLERLLKQLDRLTTLIYNLLDTTRVVGGQLVLSLAPVDLNQLLQERVDELAGTPNHQLEFIKEELPLIEADQERIGQVITNLLTNAIKYSPEQTKIKIVTQKENDFVWVHVTDHGYGISDGDQQQIFSQYFRVSSENISAQQGIGLGLYIAAQIVQRHGGVIEVKSELGKGSTFSFSLPVNQ